MPFTITRDGALPMIVRYETVIDLIPLSVPLQELLEQVVRRRKTTRMTFTDGTTGFLAGMDPEFDPSQQQLVLLPPPEPVRPGQVVRDFEVDCRVLIELDAKVTLTAADRREAEELVKSVMDGTRPAPRAFTVEIDREHLMHEMAWFDRPLLRSRELDRMDPHDVLINRIEER